MSLETRLQRLETGRGAEPTHEEWLDYMAALKRYDAGKPAAGDRDLIATFSERAASASPAHVAAYIALA
jgi:hypothetical protein